MLTDPSPRMVRGAGAAASRVSPDIADGVFALAPQCTAPQPLIEAKASLTAGSGGAGEEDVAGHAESRRAFGRGRWQGQRIRRFWQHWGLAAVNTFVGDAMPSYYGPRAKSLIDYVVLPYSAQGLVGGSRMWTHAGRML